MPRNLPRLPSDRYNESKTTRPMFTLFVLQLTELKKRGRGWVRFNEFFCVLEWSLFILYTVQPN
jgi:hypothetical protein